MIITRGLGGYNLVTRGYGELLTAIRYVIELMTQHTSVAGLEEMASFQAAYQFAQATAEELQTSEELVTVAVATVSSSNSSLPSGTQFSQIDEESEYAAEQEVSDETLPDVTTSQVAPSVTTTEIGTREE